MWWYMRFVAVRPGPPAFLCKNYANQSPSLSNDQIHIKRFVSSLAYNYFHCNSLFFFSFLWHIFYFPLPQIFSVMKMLKRNEKQRLSRALKFMHSIYNNTFKEIKWFVWLHVLCALMFGFGFISILCGCTWRNFPTSQHVRSIICFFEKCWLESVNISQFASEFSNLCTCFN